jgi:hypothetical protein
MANKSVLEKLGFTKLPRAPIDGLREKIYTRNQRRQMRNKLLRPTFTSTSLATFATDRNGDTWVGPGSIDLSKHGFIDNLNPRNINRQRDPRYN